jgi:hypothetical protein
MHKHSYLKDLLAISKGNALAVFCVTKNPNSLIFSDCRADELGMFRTRNATHNYLAFIEEAIIAQSKESNRQERPMRRSGV